MLPGSGGQSRDGERVPPLICPSEALPGLGFFLGLFAKVGLAKLLREGPRVRVRVTVIRTRSSLVPRLPASSATHLGAPAPGPAAGAGGCQL